MKTTSIVLAVATLVLNAVPAAGASSACETKVKANASRVKTAASAFAAALGADAGKRFPDGLRAVLYGNVYVNCVGAVVVGALAPGAGDGACMSAAAAADAMDPGASPRISTTGAGYYAMVLADERSAVFLKAFLARPAPESLRQLASALLAAVEEGTSILRGCSAEFSKPVPDRRTMPTAPAPPALTSFDGYLGSTFAVHLDNGKATVGSAEAILEGGVTISPKSDPSLKLSVNGRVVLKVRPRPASGPGELAMEHENVRAATFGSARQVATWVSLEGQGSARISGFGPAITIPNVALQSQASNIMFTGGEASFRGCTHTLAAGSGFTISQVLFEGSLRCGPWSLTSSSMGIDKTSVAGAGTLTAWGKSFTMSYAAFGDGLSARGSLSGADTPWTRVPGFEAEYRIERPKLDLKLEGPSLSPTFGAGRVNVRTVAKKKDGSPWSSASLTPDVMVVPAPPADAIPVPFPVLPAPADVEKAARDACEAGARRTLAGKALQGALDVCRSGHPSPPAVPTLPRTISLKVGDVLR